MCYPKIESKPIYMKRYEERGTNPEWIDRINKNFENEINGFEAQKCKKIILQNDETLEDKLIKMKYLYEP